VRHLVLEYYVVLRSILKAKAQLRPCLKSCRHCGIFFLTDPRNRGRTDLGCPFGCRDTHRRKSSTERSVAYNSSVAGKLKKKFYNGDRSGPRPPEPQPEETTGEEMTEEKQVREETTRQEQPGENDPREEPRREARAELQGATPERAERERIEFYAAVVDYLRVVISLIEGRRVSREEILEMLRVAMRQHSLARERRLDYVVRVLKQQNPP
jgi:hypothetical protein